MVLSWTIVKERNDEMQNFSDEKKKNLSLPFFQIWLHSTFFIYFLHQYLVSFWNTSAYGSKMGYHFMLPLVKQYATRGNALQWFRHVWVRCWHGKITVMLGLSRVTCCFYKKAATAIWWGHKCSLNNCINY